jgi:Rrf2 family protein
MQLTMSGEYALRAMLYMCSEPNGTTFKISDVAKKNDIPDSFLRKLVQQLIRAGLLKSTQGNGGGISLNVESEKITPLDIIEIVEGKIGLNKCLIHNDFCNRDNYCSIHIIWDEAQTQLRDKLQSKSMKELALQNSRNLTNVNSLF